MSIASRYLTRQCLVQALYQWQLNSDDIQSIIAQFISSREHANKIDHAVFKQRLVAIEQQHATLNQHIQSHLSRDQYHLGELEWAILWLAAYEICYDDQVPNRVAIDQAMVLAKAFGCEKSKGFINAVLDKINQTSCTD